MNEVRGLSGEITLPSDKSISHRAVMLGSVAHGISRMTTSTLGRDNLATIRIMRQLGVAIEGTLNKGVFELAQDEGLSDFELSQGPFCELKICGSGFEGLREPSSVLDCGNSGTSARLLTGLLAGRPFSSELTGDESLKQRPFRRVTEPLGKMGAVFSGDRLPLKISGGDLKGIRFVSPRASAQVKSAILLAGLQTDEDVVVSEPRKSRDHTELMLEAMGCAVEASLEDNIRWRVRLPARGKRSPLVPLDICVPGDFSAAAFFMVAATVVMGSDITIRNVGFNPTRIGLYSILRRMGGQFEILNQRTVCGEQVVDLRVRSTEALHGVDVGADEVVLALDEIPILAVAATLGSGTTRIRGAAELRVKESDRLAMIRRLLESFSVVVEEYQDGLSIHGNPELSQRFTNGPLSIPGRDVAWRASGDHRISMSGAVLEYAVSGKLELADLRVVETSYPHFVECFQNVSGVMESRGDSGPT